MAKVEIGQCVIQVIRQGTDTNQYKITDVTAPATAAITPDPSNYIAVGDKYAICPSLLTAISDMSDSVYGADDYPFTIDGYTIKKGLKLIDSPVGHLLASTLKSTFHRNACCVISLSAKYYQKKVSKEDKKQILQHLKATKNRDYEGIALMNILNDSDFEYCYNTLKKEIDSFFLR